MTRERLIFKPFNRGFQMMYEEFPKELHEELRVPGTFVRKTDVKVKLEDGRELEMDASYIVDPDNKIIFERMVVNLEHQSYRVGKSKIRIMTLYEQKNIHEENLPNLSVVASHIPIESHEQYFERTPSHILKPYYLDLGEKDIQERLIKVKDIIDNNKKITNNAALNLGIIVLFAPRENALEITEKVIGLYNKIRDQLSKKMKNTLYQIIFAMIDAYCDKEEDFDRMVTMLKEKNDEDNIENYEYVKRIRNSLNSARHRIVDLETEDELKQQRIVDLETEDELKQQRINDLQTRINDFKAREKVNQQRIDELVAEIEKLKKNANNEG